MSNRPFARVKYKSPDGTRYDVGTLWPARNGNGYGLTPQKTNEPGQYPKMRLSEAVRAVEDGQGYLDVWPVEERRQQRPSEQRRPQPQGQRKSREVRDEWDDDGTF